MFVFCLPLVCLVSGVPTRLVSAMHCNHVFAAMYYSHVCAAMHCNQSDLAPVPSSPFKLWHCVARSVCSTAGDCTWNELLIVEQKTVCTLQFMLLCAPRCSAHDPFRAPCWCVQYARRVRPLIVGCPCLPVRCARLHWVGVGVRVRIRFVCGWIF